MAYNSYLRGIKGIRTSDWHNLEHIWRTCKVKPLAYLFAQRKLSRLRHVARLLEAKYPHITFFAQLKGTAYGHGRLPQTFRSTVCKDFEVIDIPFQGGEWYVQTKNKPLWCQLVHGIPLIKVAPAPMHKQLAGSRHTTYKGAPAPMHKEPVRACKC